ncbi:MAG: S-layer protein [Candidatus Aenigmatarchaeota archaeon]
MVYIFEQKNGKTVSAPAKLVQPRQMATALSPLAWKILQALTEKPDYPKNLARQLKVHEQKVYYHIRNLEKAGLIRVLRNEGRQGAMAKIYSADASALAVLLKPLQPSAKLQSLKSEHKRFLEPFVIDGKLNALIIMGSPEPHGPTKVRAKDGTEAAELGLFLGSFLNYIPEQCVRLDTEIRESDLKRNLIVVGGPAVNMIMARLNEKLPIRMKQVEHGAFKFSSIYSDVSHRSYSEENHGIVVKTRNPFDRTKEVLVLAGRRSAGTKAAVLALLTKFDDLCAGNRKDPKILAKVVEGIDADSDGILDSVDVLE